MTKSKRPQKGRIFISYRRIDTSYAAGRIYDRLVEHYGEDAIFMDVDTIEGGVDFIKVLEDAVQSCDVLIALIGKQWLTVKDNGGKPRLDNPEDFVRIEIATALKRNIRVIPVLVDGVDMPLPTELPENLKALARRNALQVNHHSFNPDVYRLIEHSESALEDAEESRARKAQAPRVARDKTAKDAAEKAERQAARRDAIKNLLLKFVPFLRVFGILGIIITLFWVGSWAIPKFVALTPTAKASVEPPANTKIAVTKTPVSPTKTIRPIATPTKTRTPVPTALPAEITDAKGVSMALVPAGEFTMGSNIGEQNEKPAHQVYLDAYYIDIYEVTNALYEACVTAGGCTIDTVSSTGYGNSEFDNYPVEVNWNQSNIYCKWRGANLPTEAQWEKAARGTDGRTYPWGNDLDAYRANYYNNTGGTTAVGSYESGKSPYGVYDLAGNVQEWVADWYGWNYYTSSPYANPLGPSSEYSHEPRGGTWFDRSSHIRSAARTPYFESRPNEDSRWAGFRCAKNAP